MKRFLLMTVSLLGAIIFMFPNVSLMLVIFLAFLGKYVSALFCLMFAWNSAKFVQSIYEKSKKDTVEEERRYSYEIHDDRIDFTFIGVKDDGRQLSRLKFMREKFFKDE